MEDCTSPFLLLLAPVASSSNRHRMGVDRQPGVQRLAMAQSILWGLQEKINVVARQNIVKKMSSERKSSNRPFHHASKSVSSLQRVKTGVSGKKPMS